MSGWNEQTLRAAASWKAFKEGKALLDSGAVTAATRCDSGWSGTVIGGKRPLRVAVKVKSATDLETRCPCPENQASGALCSHAVATGLAVLAGAPSISKFSPGPSAKPDTTVPREILLHGQWREAVVRGKIAATIGHSKRSSHDNDADLRLAAWLETARVADSPNLHLSLDAGRCASFLEAISGHVEVYAGKERAQISISSGHRLELAGAELQENEVQLVPAGKPGDWIQVGGSFWQIGPDFLHRAGSGHTPTALRGTLERLTRGESASVPVPQLLSQLDVWQEWLAFPDDCWLESLHFLPAPAYFELMLDGSLHELEARLRVRYGKATPVPPGFGVVPDLPRLSAEICEVRNLQSEAEAVYRLENAGFLPLDTATGTWTLRGEPAILDFLIRTLPALESSWAISHGSRFAKVRHKIAVIYPQIDILGSGENWLSFDLEFQTNDGIRIPRGQIQQLLNTGRRSGKTSDGRQLVISNDMTELVEPLFAELDLQQKGGHYEASAATGELILEIRKKLGNQLINNNNRNSLTYSQPSTLLAKLRNYQQHGIIWLIDRAQRFGGALLADDMGLGKTIQTIALIEQLFSVNQNEDQTVLIIATASLLGNWRAEFGRFAPQRRVRILHGAGRDQEREKVAAGEIVLTSYGTLSRDLAWHLRREYLAVVVDEASLMRNPDTDHAKAVAKLRSPHRIALTGTPVENGVRDLWSIFRFIQPGWLGGREEFRQRYEAPLTAGEGAAAVMERLKLKVSPFVLRRTKEQVAPELPSKLLIDEFCDLSADQQAVYRDLLAEGRRQVESIADSGNPAAARMRMLTALLRLRQTCCDLALLGNERLSQLPPARRSAKIERLLELLEEAVNGGHRVLVFSQFQKQLLEIESCLSGRGWDCLRLDGQSRNRHELVEKFQNPQGPPVFLISLKAGGYGLNLTAADIVIHFDPWWNPAAEAQATDRAHRIGQTRPVTVYRLLTRGTVEEQVLRLQRKKRDLAAAIDETGSGDAPGWSMQELKLLISD